MRQFKALAHNEAKRRSVERQSTFLSSAEPNDAVAAVRYISDRARKRMFDRVESVPICDKTSIGPATGALLTKERS